MHQDQQRQEQRPNKRPRQQVDSLEAVEGPVRKKQLVDDSSTVRQVNIQTLLTDVYERFRLTREPIHIMLSNGTSANRITIRDVTYESEDKKYEYKETILRPFLQMVYKHPDLTEFAYAAWVRAIDRSGTCYSTLPS